MKSWRITKYNPHNRDLEGRYLFEDWTSVSDIGRIYSGEKLEVDEYLDIERKYIIVMLAAMQELKQSSLKMVLLQKNGLNLDKKKLTLDWINKKEYKGLKDNKIISFVEIPKIIQSSLREIIWCRLKGEDNFTIHFGYDFYTYIESKYDLPNTANLAKRLGLYFEEFEAPSSIRNEIIDIEYSIDNLKKFDIDYELPKEIYNQRLMLMDIEYVCEKLEETNKKWDSKVKRKAQKKVNQIVNAYKNENQNILRSLKERIKQWR